tara:strand:+ start:237 stop:851 length:615 start_codon:yes stop_codon:yes gene_type:complete
MYKTHAINCQQYAQRSANNLMEVVLMVSLSIQQNWLGVGDQIDDVRTKGLNSKYLWGFKEDTYEYLQANKHKMYAQMMAVINSNKSEDDKAYSLMKIFLRVTGLGLPKAGFACQLSAGLVGCMDVHNIKLYGIDPKTLSFNNKSKGAKGKTANNNKILKYIKVCHDYGTENLWNSWCNLLATKSSKWQDGNHVSEVHYTYLTGE